MIARDQPLTRSRERQRLHPLDAHRSPSPDIAPRDCARTLSVTPPSPRRSRVVKALCALLLFHTCAAVAQQSDADQGKFAAATLPESNEALLCSSRVEEAIQMGDYRLAIELTERLMQLPDGLVATPASRTYYPVWRQAFRLLAQLPSPGVELYRQLYDSEVSARFQAAASQADVNALRELFHGYRLSSEWPAIGVELTAHLLDQGAYGEAIAVLRELTARTGPLPTDSPRGVPREYQAQLVIALAGAGAIQPARSLLEELRSTADAEVETSWEERLQQLESWLATFPGNADGAAREPSEALAPHIEPGPAWRQEFPPDTRGPIADDRGRDLADAVDALRRLPLQQPVAAGELLVVRLHGRVWAFDAETLLPRWSAAEEASPDVGEGVWRAASIAGSRDDVRLPPDLELQLSHHLRHAVSVGFGKVYSVEGHTALDQGFATFGRQPLPGVLQGARRNELVARDLENGRVAWRTAADAASPLYDVTFQNVPVTADEWLVAPIQRGDDLALAVLDPADGQLLREVPLVGPPTYFTSEGGRCLLVAEATTLYVCTGNGVIAALTRQNLSWEWATVYPSTLAEHLGQSWWQTAETSVEMNVDPPVIADDLLIVAPVDCTEMFALDRFDGHERWRMSRREYPYLIGALRGGLVVGGVGVTCLDLNDPAGREPCWRSVPLRITGRATIRDQRVFVPTHAGIVVLDGRTGKLLADQAGATAPHGGRDGDPGASVGSDLAPDCTANLVACEDALYSVSPSRVVKYPDVGRARARYAGREEGDVEGQAHGLVLAWLDALEGRYEQALARLQAVGIADERPERLSSEMAGDSRLAAARDHLLAYVFLGLAWSSSEDADQLGWLERAAAVADSPESAAWLAVAVGRTLEQSGQWAAALRHYGNLLCRPEACQVVDGSDADRRVAGWLHAAERIAAIRTRASATALTQLSEQALSQDARRSINLQRFRIALSDTPQAEQVERLLSVQPIAPELKVQFLPTGDLATLPPAWRRRVLLERWDTRVSLGDLERAQADREVWEMQFAHAPQPDASDAQSGFFKPLSPDEERERVEAIDLASRKLAQSSGPPFTRQVTRQWKIERGEFLLDSRRPLTGSRPWVLTANIEQQRIELINAFKHQYPQRQTEDGLVGAKAGMGRAAATPDAAAQPGRGLVAQSTRRFEWEGGERQTWPVVTYHELAAIPVRGGLICVGMGPERYAGRRQWEYAVPEWDAVPTAFADCSVAGAPGVFFCPRRDRVALVGWFDGQLWWQRSLPGVAIERLYLCGGQLVIVSDDQRVWVTDATFGRALRPVQAEVGTPGRIDVVGETIVVWGSQAVQGISSTTLNPIWTRRCAPVVDSTVVEPAPGLRARQPFDHGAHWVAYRVESGFAWHLLDAASGDLVFEASLGEFHAVSAIVLDAKRLFVAGWSAGSENEEEPRRIRVSALDPADGTRLWSREFQTAVAVNSAQLAAHPELIPILLAGTGGVPSTESDLPAIQLVNKRDGELGEPLSIKADYRPVVEATCAMYMLVTPTRMIVQAGGNLIAYGNSPLRSGP